MSKTSDHLAGFDCIPCGHAAIAHYRGPGCRGCEREGRPFCNADPKCWCGDLASKHEDRRRGHPMSDTTAEGLTEGEREALAEAVRILADRLAAVQAEVLRLMAARDTYRKHAEADRDERDAARAEVEALRERVARVESLADEYAGVVAMTERSDRRAAGLNEFRQVIADLRAALEADR